MIYDGPIALLQEAQRRGIIKLHMVPDQDMPTIDVINEQRFELFLIETAGKTDSENERCFCLNNLESFQHEEFSRKVDDLSENLKNCQTFDDIINIME